MYISSNMDIEFSSTKLEKSGIYSRWKYKVCRNN